MLSPDEIHRLASKTRATMHADRDKAACHSDYTDDEQAKRLQTEQLPIVD